MALQFFSFFLITYTWHLLYLFRIYLCIQTKVAIYIYYIIKMEICHNPSIWRKSQAPRRATIGLFIKRTRTRQQVVWSKNRQEPTPTWPNIDGAELKATECWQTYKCILWNSTFIPDYSTLCLDDVHSTINEADPESWYRLRSPPTGILNEPPPRPNRLRSDSLTVWI